MTEEHPRHPRAATFVRLFAGVTGFKELESRIAGLPTEQERGAAFEVFAEAYLATQRKYDVSDVWPQKVIPLELLAQLALTVNDYGVDGVCKTKLGRFDAYQVKFRTARPALTWRELSTFMGLADSAHFQSRIVFTNCDDLPSVLNERKGFFCIRGSDLDRLDKDDFQEIESWLTSAVVERRRKTPDENHKHQAEALAEILSKFQRYDRTSAIMACGSGKTLLALWVAERLGSAKVLVLLPSLALLRQTLHEWLHETSWERLAYLCVCSDPTVAAELDTIHTQPSDLDFPVDTDSAAVREFLDAEFNGVRIVFSTYQSAHIVAQGMKPGEAFDVGIFDEAHKTAGREGRKFAFALEDANLLIRKRLFLTATPRHYDIAKRNKEGDSTLVYSMDKPSTYGPVAYKLPFPEATRRGIICDYKVLISIITSEMVNEELLRRGVVLVEGEEVKARQVANQIALAKAVEQHQVRRIFTFHSSIRSAASFAATGSEGVQTQLPDFRAYHVNGAMPTSLRERCMNDFRAATKAVMSNARCLTEGVDVPAVDMVAFMSPRRSTVDIVQATGRAIRRSGDKKIGYVLVPLYLEQPRGETVEEAVKRGGFDEIWNVLQSLKEHDEILADIITEMREERGRTKGYDDSRFREKVEVLGPELSLDDLRKSITAACVDALGVSWDERYGELVAYKERFGSCEMPYRWAENQKLATWVVAQRQNKQKGKLTKEQVQLLDYLGFIWQPHSRDWRGMYLRLLEYKRVHGDCNVPQKWLKDRKLAGWVRTQREKKTLGKVSAERIRLLDNLGFEWNRANPAWEERFRDLERYKREHGDCNVPARWPKNRKLAGWVIYQRQHKKKGKLPQEYIDRLTAIGFVWRAQLLKNDAEWMEMYEKLKSYRNEHGHCRVPKRHPARSLVTWVWNQWKLKRKAKLAEARVHLLEKVGFEWKGVSDRFKTWDEMFGALVEYKKERGDCRVPSSSKHDQRLAKWVMEQRRAKRRGDLGDDRIRRLNEVGFDWNPYSSRWEEMVAELIRYRDKHGNCNVPQKLPENPRLAKWVMTQRRLKGANKLSDDRIRQLSEVGLQWVVFDARWDEMFKRLVEYYKIHGNCNVPGKWRPNPSLGRWVMTQRIKRRADELSEDRVHRLNEIGFEWEVQEAAWQELHQKLVLYRQVHGDCRVPADWPENPRLAKWVAVQRRHKTLGRLKPERIAALDEIGFVWRVGPGANRNYEQLKTEKWNEMFEALRRYREVHGDCLVPQRWRENPGLSWWVSHQRTLRSRGLLAAGQERQLTELGFVWDPVAAKWDEWFAKLLEFKRIHSHTNVPQRVKQYTQLANWVRNQRRDYKMKRPIMQERAKRLNEIGFSWRLVEPQSWEKMFAALVEYKKAHGNCNVPQRWHEKRLAKWVNTQRTAYKRGKLRPDRQRQLESIGFVWNAATRRVS